MANIAPQFGSGVLYGIPNAGNLAPNPTPGQFGLLQEVSVNLKGDLKKLFGMNQYAAFAARGKTEVTAKGKMGSLDPLFFSQLYFGLPTAVGGLRPVYNESGGAFVSDVITPVNTPVNDLGVIIVTASTTGLQAGTQMTAVSVAPTVSGTYQFTAGTYKFLAADVTAGLTVAISYEWSDTAHGTTLAVGQQLMGYAPQFTAVLWNDFRSSGLKLKLNACILGSVSIPTKQEDFWVSDFDMEAFADLSGNVLSIFSDVS